MIHAHAVQGRNTRSVAEGSLWDLTATAKILSKDYINVIYSPICRFQV